MKNSFLFLLAIALFFIWGCDPGWAYRITRPQVERKNRHYELSYNDLNFQIEAHSFVMRDHIEIIISTNAESSTLQPGIISMQLLSRPEHMHIPEVFLILRDENKKVLAEEKAAGTLIPKKPLVIRKGEKIYLYMTFFTMLSVNNQLLPDANASEFLFRYYFPETGASFKCVFDYDPDFY